VQESLIIGALAALAYIFIPNATDGDKIKEAAGPNNHEFLSFSEFTEKYGTPAEKAEIAREREEEQRAAREELQTEESVEPPNYGY
jgi:hypothetical protein